MSNLQDKLLLQVYQLGHNIIEYTVYPIFYSSF